MIDDVTRLRVREEIEHALACLTEEFVPLAERGSRGLRVEAIMHLRTALLLLQGSPPASIAGSS
jgi:hypothetical protein